jgi:hypothetical protein
MTVTAAEARTVEPRPLQDSGEEAGEKVYSYTLASGEVVSDTLLGAIGRCTFLKDMPLELAQAFLEVHELGTQALENEQQTPQPEPEQEITPKPNKARESGSRPEKPAHEDTASAAEERETVEFAEALLVQPQAPPAAEAEFAEAVSGDKSTNLQLTEPTEVSTSPVEELPAAEIAAHQAPVETSLHSASPPFRDDTPKSSNTSPISEAEEPGPHVLLEPPSASPARVSDAVWPRSAPGEGAVDDSAPETAPTDWAEPLQSVGEVPVDVPTMPMHEELHEEWDLFDEPEAAPQDVQDGLPPVEQIMAELLAVSAERIDLLADAPEDAAVPTFEALESYESEEFDMRELPEVQAIQQQVSDALPAEYLVDDDFKLQSAATEELTILLVETVQPELEDKEVLFVGADDSEVVAPDFDWLVLLGPEAPLGHDYADDELVNLLSETKDVDGPPDLQGRHAGLDPASSQNSIVYDWIPDQVGNDEHHALPVSDTTQGDAYESLPGTETAMYELPALDESVQIVVTRVARALTETQPIDRTVILEPVVEIIAQSIELLADQPTPQTQEGVVVEMTEVLGTFCEQLGLGGVAPNDIKALSRYLLQPQVLEVLANHPAAGLDQLFGLLGTREGWRHSTGGVLHRVQMTLPGIIGRIVVLFAQSSRSAQPQFAAV